MRIEKTASDDIERAIIAAVDAVCRDPNSRNWDDATWTRNVKNAVGRLGRDRKCWVYASGCDYANAGEWLYDLLWLEYDGSRLAGAALVLESEWNPRGLEDDFQKLVLARADHRAFLFDPGPGADGHVVDENLLQHARSSRHTVLGDRYLFGVWDETKWAFEWLVFEAVRSSEREKVREKRREKGTF